jgi:hypothetical protein
MSEPESQTPSSPDDTPTVQAVGSVITPTGIPRAPEHRVGVLETPAAPEPTPAPVVAAAPEEPAPDQGLAVDNNGIISWVASEFVVHEKSAGWYGALTGSALLGALIVFAITRDFVSSGVIVVCAIFFGIYANRKPRQLQYQLGDRGFSVGQKHFSYDEFRSFSVVDDGAFSSIVFAPLKRFALLITIYFAPEDEDDIIAVLSDRLPYEEHTPDSVERLMRRIRF